MGYVRRVKDFGRELDKKILIYFRITAHYKSLYLFANKY